MTNVIAIDEGKVRRDQRIRELARPTHMRNLCASIALLNSRSRESVNDEFRDMERERLQQLLRKTVAELAIWDSPDGMIEFAEKSISAYRSVPVGGCSNE